MESLQCVMESLQCVMESLQCQILKKAVHTSSCTRGGMMWCTLAAVKGSSCSSVLVSHGLVNSPLQTADCRLTSLHLTFHTGQTLMSMKYINFHQTISIKFCNPDIFRCTRGIKSVKRCATHWHIYVFHANHRWNSETFCILFTSPPGCTLSWCSLQSAGQSTAKPPLYFLTQGELGGGWVYSGHTV